MTPHPDRVGGLAWTRRTGGALTPRVRRRLLGEIVRAQGTYVAGRIRLATGRVPSGDLAVDLRPPDGAVARTAEDAARAAACGASDAVDDAITAHPRDGVIAAVSALVRAEAKRNPRGRFALLRSCGILPLFAITPLTPR